MRFIISFIFLFMILPCLQAQEKEKWQRLANYEDSTVDLDDANVTFSTAFSGRIRFRFTLSKPEPVSKGATIKYKSIIETVEFKCEERQYRFYEVVMFDRQGKVIDSEKRGPEKEWREVKGKGLLERLYRYGCDLIWDRKRHPRAVEKS